MPSPTDFNLSPYFDDFSESKKFHRVLFRPAFAVSNGNQTAFSGANTITGQSSSVTATPSTSSTTVDSVVFTSGYNAGEIDADTGDIMYIENRSPITRAADQTENVKLIIEF